NGIMLRPMIDMLEAAGYIIERGDSFIYAVSAGNEKVKCSIVTEPYPGFPTDLQPQLTVFLTRNGAGSVIKENIFENRLDYAHQLKKMGADIEISQKEVIIKNNNILCGTYVEAKDLRGGAALMIAGLMAEGETIVGNTKYIKRGYSRIGEKIRGLGGEITENEG
ncbi:MAG: UDP-N-acetylglucosamine 1-carboxyvinyltransferase, partial [Firmicutes bacterium]|nr:UDP-N-acetylglucosamine 1-carboxyvinyltransferase [Bacillota bacterium]